MFQNRSRFWLIRDFMVIAEEKTSYFKYGLDESTKTELGRFLRIIFNTVCSINQRFYQMVLWPPRSQLIHSPPHYHFTNVRQGYPRPPQIRSDSFTSFDSCGDPLVGHEQDGRLGCKRKNKSFC